MSANYSFETSKPAYQFNQANAAKKQCEKVLNAVINGAETLKEIEEVTGIPQAIVSARMSDLEKEKKLMYFGKVVYKKFTRKRIVLAIPQSVGEQAKIFND